MKPATYNFTILQGSTLNKIFTLKNEDGTTFSLTGYTAVMKARQEVATAAAVIGSAGSPTNLTLTLTVLDGTITMAMTAAQTAALDFSTAVWDMELTIGANVQRWFQGIITLSKEITR
tara:strand:- start:369 stop:722 length:354 start_codon:yes stop_codon:yes gene_type:complete